MIKKKKVNVAIKSIERAFSILEIVGRQDTDIRVTEISRMTNFPKSATFRILSTLISLGYISQDKDTKRYYLGLKASHLANLLEGKRNLCLQVRPFLEKLSASYNETVNLGILDQGRVLYLDSIEGSQFMRMISLKGVSGFLHSTSLGKVLLAYLPDQKVDEIINKEGLPRFTKNTITDPGRLKRQLKLIRECGYATDKDEGDLGVSCVASPIKNYTGQVIAAISIIGPTTRIFNSIDELSKLTIKTTDLISKKLGYKSR